MRIGIFDDLVDGGAKRVVYEQVKGLAGEHELYYVTNREVSFFDMGKKCAGTKQFDLRLFEYSGILRPLKDLSLLTWLPVQYQKIAQYFGTMKVQVVIGHPSHLTQAPLLFSKLHIPSLYFAEEWLRLVYEPEFFPLQGEGMQRKYEQLRRGLVKTLDWYETKRATRIVVSSEFVRGEIARAYKRKTQVIPLGVDLQAFYPAPERQKRYFLFVGEREKINGYDLLVEALHQSTIPFKVKFVEFKEGNFAYSDNDMNELYQGAVATLCLGRNEPFGLSALESMAAGTPVIALNSGGYSETIRSNTTGVLIDPQANALYLAMKHMAVEKEWREQVGIEARSYVEKKYSWRNHVQQLEAVLEDLIR